MRCDYDQKLHQLQKISRIWPWESDYIRVLEIDVTYLSSESWKSWKSHSQSRHTLCNSKLLSTYALHCTWTASSPNPVPHICHIPQHSCDIADKSQPVPMYCRVLAPGECGLSICI